MPQPSTKIAGFEGPLDLAGRPGLCPTSEVQRRLALAGLAFLCACGDDTMGVGPADAGPPTIAIGTGEREFEELRDGNNILVVQGPQDGYHFFGSLRATNVNAGDSEDLTSPDNPTTTFGIFVGMQQVNFTEASTYTQGLRVSSRGAEMIGRNVILDIQDDSELDGVEVRFTVRVDDVDGVSVSDERTLIARPHPNNQ